MKRGKSINSADPIPASPTIQSALRLLLEAHELARKAREPVEEFALELLCLLHGGSSGPALHWLVGAGHVHCLITKGPSGRKKSKQSVFFTENTRFILTDSGIALACSYSTEGTAVHDRNTETPHWDGARELWFAGQLIKDIKGSAEMQTAVLAAFEKQQWKRCIANPFIWRCETDQRKRLLNATQRLNGGQITQLLKFHVNGGGTHVGWEDLRHIATAESEGQR